MPLLIIIHHPVLWPFDVVELAGLCGPEKDEPAGKADCEHENDECNDCPKHRLSIPLKRPAVTAATPVSSLGHVVRDEPIYVTVIF